MMAANAGAFMSTTYDTYQRVLQALGWIAQGYPETQACDGAGISIPLFEKTIEADEELGDEYRTAKRRGHDAMSQALLQIDNHKIYGHTDSKMAAVISKNIQWYLSKSDPHRFAERIEVKHELKMDRAIVDALMRARERTDTIDDVSYTDVTPQSGVKMIDLVPVVEEQSDEDIMRELMGE
jgi:hypothetical protein